MGRKLRVAGAQIAVTNDVAANVAAISRAIEFASAHEADILLTPEGSLSGYRHDFDEAEVRAGLEVVRERAANAKVGLALGTCFQESDGTRYNQIRFYGRDGSLIGWHSKILLCRRVGTDEVGELGQFASKPLEVFQFDGLTVGGLICNDMWANPEWTPQDDPHLSRQLAHLGASVVFVAVNASVGAGEELALHRHYHESNLRLRARSGKQWFVVADAADPAGRLGCMAPGGVIGPDGNWVVQADPVGEQMFLFTVEV